MMKTGIYSWLILLCGLATSTVVAQETFPVNGPHSLNENYYCLYNGVIHMDADRTLDKGTIIIRKGKIESVNGSPNVPQGAVGIDLKGKHVYASFIDTYSDYGFKEEKRQPGGDGPQYETSKGTATYWNEAVHPEASFAALFEPDAKTAAALRAIGFGTVLSHRQDGIVRGTSALVTLGDERANNEMLHEDVAMQFSFRKGSSHQAYPQSVMGSIALLMQFLNDAQWYAAIKNKKEENLSLAAYNKFRHILQIFEANDKYNILRADKIGDHFGFQFVFKGDGKEYQRIRDILNTKGTIIVPVNFPDAYEVDDAYSAQQVSLQDMKHWELASYNLSYLSRAGIPFVITASDLKDKKSFLSNLRKAVKNGLSEAIALRALTTSPALLMGVDQQLGTLEPGKTANFFVASDNIFSESAVIYENWVNGKKYSVSEENPVDVRGDFDVNIENHIYSLKVKGEISKVSATVRVDTTNIKAKVSVEKSSIAISFNPDDKFYRGTILLSGNINFDSGSWDGNAQLPDGRWVKWSAIRKNKFSEPKKKEEAEKTDSTALGVSWYPFMAYGWDSLPAPTQVLIKNTTVWTNEEEGILKNTDVLLRDGKIVKIGKILDVVDKKTLVIDGSGKHLTSGIIDEHSHIAIYGGVNEGSHAVTAEVSIADVINPEDINIYRQLAGGVTAAQLLHGSANPIGGRSALIKLRWGKSPEEMKIEDAPGFIKFALGENVKQSNWGERFSSRYPQTRMGVEQVLYDAFYRAKAYEEEWKNYETHKGKGTKHHMDLPRKDIQLDVLVEILNGKRFITCHSYVQSEINMLMKVADSMGFKVNTFTHILEGYKVADKMKAHGANASTFSDWWAYKYEVMEAIPYNAAILAAVGVTTAINSDDAEMARRLNQEAAKGMKYGGMSEAEAWKMVTLNPAKMLHLDHRMGSIKVGKDADVVLWSDNPLTIYAKVEKTFIDGVCYYDMQRDSVLRTRNQTERMRLIDKMIGAKREGAPVQRGRGPRQLLWHCDTEGEFTNGEEQ